MHGKSINLARAFTLFYTWVVVLSCTTIGHIFSNTLNIYGLTAAVVISIIFILTNRLIIKGFRVKSDLIFLIYSALYIYAAIRGIGGLEAYLPLAALVVCAYWGGNYAFDVSLARRLIEAIATIATALLLLQVCTHYIFGGHIQMIPTSFLTQEQFESYDTVIRTGFSTNSTYYRPSAFFLEPSHYVQFTTVSFLSALYPDGRNRPKLKKAIFYTVGIIATISSTGLALLIVFWALWILFSETGSRLPKVMKALIVVLMVVFVFLVVASSNSVLGVYMQRIFPSNLMNLITNQGGRFWAARYLDSFTNTEWLIGKGIGTEPSGFYTGYVRIVYRMGVIGFIAYVILLAKVAVEGKGFNRYVCIAYIILLFGAEVDILRYVVFYLTFAFVGYSNTGLIKRLKAKMSRCTDRKAD